MRDHYCKDGTTIIEPCAHNGTDTVLGNSKTCICITKSTNSAAGSTIAVLTEGDMCTASGKALKECAKTISEVECVCAKVG